MRMNSCLFVSGSSVVAAIVSVLICLTVVSSTHAQQPQQGLIRRGPQPEQNNTEVIIYVNITPVRYEAVKGTGVFLGSTFNDGRWNIKVMDGAQEIGGLTSDLGGFFQFRCRTGAYQNLRFIILGGAAYKTHSLGVSCQQPGIRKYQVKMQ